MTQFNSLGVTPELCKALSRADISKPTPIQKQSIPLAIEGHDILGLAQTGTGKTLSFGLPIIANLLAKSEQTEQRSARALILAPTRELANQIADSLRPILRPTPLRIAIVVGGKPINRQIASLARGTDILVATPGRLIDLMDRNALKLSLVRHLVLDEADQMLDLGFIHALRRIAPELGSPRQTLLFSATMSKQMEELARQYLTDPKRVQVSPSSLTVDQIQQTVQFVEKEDKPARLREILSRDLNAPTLVFSRTKYGAEKLMRRLVADGYNATSIHGNKSQAQRDRAIKALRDGTVSVLVATDVAARGIDIPSVELVVNYELPNVAEAYVHRIGRTGRAGRTGAAISLCSPEERAHLQDIEKLIKRQFARPAGEDDQLSAPPSRRSGPKRVKPIQQKNYKSANGTKRRSGGSRSKRASRNQSATNDPSPGLSNMLTNIGRRSPRSAA